MKLTLDKFISVLPQTKYFFPFFFTQPNVHNKTDPPKSLCSFWSQKGIYIFITSLHSTNDRKTFIFGLGHSQLSKYPLFQSSIIVTLSKTQTFFIVLSFWLFQILKPFQSSITLTLPNTQISGSISQVFKPLSSIILTLKYSILFQIPIILTLKYSILFQIPIILTLEYSNLSK